MTDEERRREAREIYEEEQAEKARRPPLSMTGVEDIAERLNHTDACERERGLIDLRALRQSEEWGRADAVKRATIAAWLSMRCSHFKDAIGMILGAKRRLGRWIDADIPRDGEEAPEEFVTFLRDADEEPDRHDPIAPGAAYPGKAVLLHSQRGAGKTTIMAWLAARAAAADGRRVLIVTDDDPGSWRGLLQRFGAHPERVAYGSARELVADGALERVVEHHRFHWIIVDNWRNWGIASGIAERGGFGNTEAAGVPIQRLVDVVRDTDRAMSVIANEGWHNQDRSRDSSVVEDAVDATRQVGYDETTRITTIRLPWLPKTRAQIDRDSYRWRYRDDESGFDLLDANCGDDGGDAHGRRNDDADFEATVEYLMRNPETTWRQFLMRDGVARSVLNLHGRNGRLKAVFDRAKGHDFLEHARNDTRWKKAKDKVMRLGGAVTLQVMKIVLEDLMSGELGL